MGVPIVELRIWTSYPGQFPGQPGATNHITIRLQDPDRRLAKNIEKLEHFRKRLLLYRPEERRSMIDRIKINRIESKSGRTKSWVMRSLKKAALAPAAILELSGESFYEMEDPQWRELPGSFDKAERIYLYAFEAEDLFTPGPRKSYAHAEIRP